MRSFLLLFSIAAFAANPSQKGVQIPIQQYQLPNACGSLFPGLANMRTDATEGAMTEFLKEIDRIRNQPVPESELEEHKRALVAGFALSLEDPKQLLDFAITQKLYGFPADYWDTYPAKISAVTAEQVARVANQYLQPENLQIVAVGDAAKVKPVLDRLGTVTLYDTAGNKK